MVEVLFRQDGQYHQPGKKTKKKLEPNKGYHRPLYSGLRPPIRFCLLQAPMYLHNGKYLLKQTICTHTYIFKIIFCNYMSLVTKTSITVISTHDQRQLGREKDLILSYSQS